MSEAPKKLWVEWPKANHLDVAYDEPPVSEHDVAQSAYTRSDLCITRAEADAMVAAERQKWEKLAASQYEAGHKAGWNAAIRKGETP